MSDSSDTSSSTASHTASHPNANRPPARLTPPRQRFTGHLLLQQKAKRTVQAYTAWIYDLARFHKRSPDQLRQPENRVEILHLITERNHSVTRTIATAKASNRDRTTIRRSGDGGWLMEPWMLSSCASVV
ncbi:MAG: phage integrase N-terminal SAM-like domain-containing protein [Verrucomicrobiae bacterium]|nr:phage integrase N-terminal SAM-like domain-containing protein [Verrucomicrobiae bacterium]